MSFLLRAGSPRYNLFIAVVSLIVVVAAGALITFGMVSRSEARTEQREREQDRIWCALLIGLDQPPPPGVELTERQKEIAAEIHEIRVGLNC